MTVTKRTRPQWLVFSRKLPASPGVYVMKDQQDSVIYVGKAKSLRARVSQYFQEGTSDYRAFIGLLSRILSDIETIVTRSEKEALLLEREMIRRHEPRFNIIWRDDKQYLCLRIDTQHQWPRVEVIRRIKKDGARYFGPYHSASAARQMLRVVNRHFQLRTCRDSVLYNRSRPCLEYQIGRCPAPCVLEVDQAAYKENVDDVLMFLEGKTEPLVQRLENRMWSAAKDEAYERAGHYRDQLSAVRKTMERQTVALTQLRDIEVIGLYREARDVALSVVEVRDGRVENVRTVLFETQAAEDQEIVSSFILQRAMEVSPSAWVPELFVPLELDDASVLSEIILDEMGSQVSIRRPQRGDGKKLLDLAQQNAEHGFHEQRLKTGALERTLEGLQSRLSLSRLPLKIECYDISNLGSHLIVGAQVTFERAAPAKKLYRKYRVRRTAGQDDFASMYEVLSRRFAKECSAGTMPDLVVIDGGKGQLEVARAVFRDLKVEQVDLISLAKSRVVAQDAEGSSVRSPERVFVPGRKEPIILPQSSPEVLLLARIRDEAHRFGITFHRELRRQTRLRSSLEDIPGVGEKRKKVLLRHFGSLKKIQEASVEELEAVQGLGHSAAVRIYEALQNSRTAPESLSESPEEAEDDESRIRATQKR